LAAQVLVVKKPSTTIEGGFKAIGALAGVAGGQPLTDAPLSPRAPLCPSGFSVLV
jgi:hypothetical protein